MKCYNWTVLGLGLVALNRPKDLAGPTAAICRAARICRLRMEKLKPIFTRQRAGVFRVGQEARAVLCTPATEGGCCVHPKQSHAQAKPQLSSVGVVPA